MSNKNDLSFLCAPRDSSAPRALVPIPARNWKTRILLPWSIVTVALVLLAYAARGSLVSTVDVWVAPVVAKPVTISDSPTSRGSAGEHGAAIGTALAQAPGWVEADPYPVSVQALADGVIKEVLVLEGQHVEAGQEVARMIDDDAKLSLHRTEAELLAKKASQGKAEAEVGALRARAAELRDKLQREKSLVSSGAAAAGPVARLEIQLAAMEKDIEAAQSGIELAAAEVHIQEVARNEARLRLDRMSIKAPCAGVVMNLLVEPGSRMSMGPHRPGDMLGAIVRIYDPEKLQVRVDVPLADIAKIGVGTPAQIMTEALPDKTFHGVVSRMVNEANIQRNTVQVKVAISDPSPVLKPEMLTRVRFFALRSNLNAADSGEATADNMLRMLVPRAAILNEKNSEADVWVAEQLPGRSTTVASLRHVRFIGDEIDGYRQAADGLQPGLRLIVDPPAGMKAGQRVRALGEKH